MMNINIRGLKCSEIDLVGFLAALVCMVHCLAVPILLGLGMSFSWLKLDHHLFDILFIALGALTAGASLFHSLRKHHQSYIPMIMMFLGLGILAFGHEHNHTQINWKMVLGGGILATAHVVNWWYVKKAGTMNCCDH